METVRGNIKEYLRKKAPLLQPTILEIGSRMYEPNAWWVNNRDLAPDMKWLGVDMQEGHNVDAIEDIHAMSFNNDSFGSILCSEVLEHVRKPWVAFDEMYRVLKPDGWCIVTTLFSFPIHGFPDDYWRFTPNGMWHLMNDAGFKNIEVQSAGDYDMVLVDHDGAQTETKIVSKHIFAVGQK